MQKRLCPNAKTLLDFYHVLQHASDCAKVILEEDPMLVRLFRKRVNVLLCTGRIAQFFDELKECTPYKPRKKVDKRNRDALEKRLKYL